MSRINKRFLPAKSSGAEATGTMTRAAELFSDLENLLDEVPTDGRLKAMAITKLEEAAMIYNKAVAFGGD